MELNEFLKQLVRDPDYGDQIVHIESIPAHQAIYGELDSALNPILEQQLHASGIQRLYSHQAEAVNLARKGQNVTVATSTASGKSLCYHIPVIEAILKDKHSRALYLFPTKALAQDQLGKLEKTGLGDQLIPACYDADTPQRERRLIRTAARTVLTNPDMLHVGILPYHTLWAQFFRNLKIIVLDEVHTYRGVFGSHVGNILRRLRRICAHYGSNPIFIACSATISNPGQLVEDLTGVPTKVIERNGAPSGPRLFVFWEPEKLKNTNGERRSANIESARLTARLARAGIRSITFTRARVSTELLLRYARKELDEDVSELSDKIASYRAGYTADERRRIEQRLFNGELLGVTATSALELGVDIGGLDACVMTGYPGSIASTWQQAGRAGRSKKTSLAILIAGDGPLDHYLIRNPDYLFKHSTEQAIIDPENPYVLAEQLLCAAYEIPLSETDLSLFGKRTSGILELLEQSGSLLNRDRWYWVGDGYPAGAVNIRTSGGQPFQILDVSRQNHPMGTADAANAFLFLHEGAIYLHAGESYLVESLDIKSRIAYVRPGEFPYYTVAQSSSTVSVIEEQESSQIGPIKAAYGEVEVTNLIWAYRKKRLITNEILGTVSLDLPPQTYQTQSLWLIIPESIKQKINKAGLDFAGGIHAIEHTMIGLLPLLAIADRQDVGGISNESHPDLSEAAIFIYDGYPGGVGITKRCFDMLEKLLKTTHDAIIKCDCKDGCPSCIQSPRCGNNNHPLDKRAAVLILESLLESSTL